MKLSLLCCLICLLAAGAARAFPSLAGPTGSGVLPTAEVLGKGDVDIAYDFFANAQDVEIVESKRVVLGVLPNTEIGYALTSAKDVPAVGKSWHVKYRAWHDEMNEVSLGYRGGNGPDTLGPDVHTRQVFVAGTRHLVRGVSLLDDISATAGLNWTELTVGDDKKTAARPYLAVKALTILNLGLCLDVQFPDQDIDDDPLYSVTLRSGLLHLGITNMSPVGVTAGDELAIFGGVVF